MHGNLGGDTGLAGLRERLRKRGLRLMLDFVVNHMAPDHPWIDEHPDYFVHGSENDLAHAPRELLPRANERTDRWCSPTAATRTLTAGLTRASSTTATRTCSRR